MFVEESGESRELRTWRARALLYKKIIERYADAVNAGEQKTIPDLKSLVNPLDEGVQSLRKRFLSELQRSWGSNEGGEAVEPYRFERDFAAFAEKAFNYVQSLERIHSELSASFWMTPKEIIEFGAADAFDRCILLCSILLSGGCENCKVRVLEVEGGVRHPVVIFYYRERQCLMDAMQEASAFTFSGSLEDIFRQYSFEGKRVLASAFEFNNSEYNEFE